MKQEFEKYIIESENKVKEILNSNQNDIVLKISLENLEQLRKGFALADEKYQSINYIYSNFKDKKDINVNEQDISNNISNDVVNAPVAEAVQEESVQEDLSNTPDLSVSNVTSPVSEQTPTPVEESTTDVVSNVEAPVESVNTDAVLPNNPASGDQVVESATAENSVPLVDAPKEGEVKAEIPDVAQDSVVAAVPAETQAPVAVQPSVEVPTTAQTPAATTNSETLTFTKLNNNQVKAILVSQSQAEKLINSQHVQEMKVVNSAPVVSEAVVAPGEEKYVVTVENMEEMLKKSQELYAQGKAAIAEDIMKQITQLNNNANKAM